MKVYVVANLKGDVGKTTTTNVAYTFSEMGGSGPMSRFSTS